MGTMGNPAVLAGAISEALVTTAAGLVVSIPAVIFYNYFIAEVNRMVTEMESSVSDLVILLVAGRKKHEVQA
jgi:biopolymer transport protein ExbB